MLYSNQNIHAITLEMFVASDIIIGIINQFFMNILYTFEIAR